MHRKRGGQIVKQPSDTLKEHSLANVLERIAVELGSAQNQLVQLEQVLFGWLASAQAGGSMPSELHKLDLTVQTIADLRAFLLSISEVIPAENTCNPSSAIAELRLEALRERLGHLEPNVVLPGSNRPSKVEIF